MSLKDHCHCQHAKESHHEKKWNCSALYCDCKKYQLYSDPYVEDPTPTPRTMRAADPLIDPFDGYDDAPITWPMFPAAPWVPGDP